MELIPSFAAGEKSSEHPDHYREAHLLAAVDSHAFRNDRTKS
jgi:hypothetical protein